MVIGASSRAFATTMVTSTALLDCMLRVLWMVSMSTGCVSIAVIRMSSSTVLPALVFVFSHRYSSFGYFVIWLFNYFVARIFYGSL